MRARRVDVPASKWTQVWQKGDRVYGIINCDVGDCIIKEVEGSAETFGWPLEPAPEKRGEGGRLMLAVAESMGSAFHAYSGTGTILCVLEA